MCCVNLSDLKKSDRLYLCLRLRLFIRMYAIGYILIKLKSLLCFIQENLD